MIKRYLEDRVRKDLEEKMVFLSGPRQVGKTTLAQSFLQDESDRYYNWGRREDRKEILSARWPAVPSTVVLDELHKYRRWKNWIKGEYDTHGDRVGLHYLRDASKREVDFLVTFEKKPWFAVECKVRRESASPALKYFGERLGIPYLFQIHLEGKEDLLDGKVRVMPAAKFLAALP